MFSNVFGNARRGDKYLDCLRDFILQKYNINAASLIPAKRGYYGETWRLNTVDNCYFVKLDYSPNKEIYKRSFPVIQHLCDHGINFISRIVKTKDGSLSAQFEGAILGIFEWIDGDNIQNEQTKIEEYKILAEIYAVSFDGIVIPRDEFSTANADLFYRQWDKLKNASGNKNSAAVLSVLEQYGSRFRERADRLALFAEKCKSDTSHFYITHGDAGGNIIVNDNKYYLVDWDDVRLAPPERDAWFCLYWEWAMTAFNGALKANRIDYILRSERLAYYCYDMFFFYLNAYMKTYFALGGDSMAKMLTDYLNGWIEEEMRYADKIQ